MLLATSLLGGIAFALWRNAKQLEVDVRNGASAVTSALGETLYAKPSEAGAGGDGDGEHGGAGHAVAKDGVDAA